jgi:hypothetical protein
MKFMRILIALRRNRYFTVYTSDFGRFLYCEVIVNQDETKLVSLPWLEAKIPKPLRVYCSRSNVRTRGAISFTILGVCPFKETVSQDFCAT